MFKNDSNNDFMGYMHTHKLAGMGRLLGVSGYLVDEITPARWPVIR